MPAAPNVLVILSDQLRRQALSCYGDPNVSTPNVDRLAAEGVRFDAACSTCSVCVPFRFSLMTGQYAHTRLVPNLTWRMSPSERTLADEFNEAGYHTVYVGKWHLEGTGRMLPVPRSRQGRWHKWFGFELRNSHFDTFYFEDGDPTPQPLGKYQTDGLFELTMGYLEGGAGAEKPFCCVLSVEPPHFPYEAPEEHLANWRDRPLQLPPSFETELDYYVPLSHWPDDAGRTAEMKKDRVRTYYAMIENLDWNVGRMLEFLERTGLAEDTVVVLMADHGEMGGAHGLPTAMKTYPFEESIAIPLIVRDPRRPDLVGRMIADPVGTEDLHPTLCGLAGIQPAQELPGTDLTPLIRGERDGLERDGILLEAVQEFREAAAFYRHAFRGIRTRRWKYTVLSGPKGVGPWQLFDMCKDPYEMDNLASRPEYRERIRKLHEALRRKLAETEDHFVLPPPAECSEGYL